MSMLASMSKQSDGLRVPDRLEDILIKPQPTMTISEARSTWYHDYTDWQWSGGLT
jgi:hypothetical protein